jgi:hypothetical protein
MSTVLKALCQHQPDAVFSWAFELVSQHLRVELLMLTQPQHGFNLNVKHAMAVSLSGSFMQDLAQKMKGVTPQLWSLIHDLLDTCQDSQLSRCIDRENSEKGAIKRLGRPKEAGRLAELGEEVERSVDDIEMEDGAREDENEVRNRESKKT